MRFPSTTHKEEGRYFLRFKTLKQRETLKDGEKKRSKMILHMEDEKRFQATMPKKNEELWRKTRKNSLNSLKTVHINGPDQAKAKIHDMNG